jgi:hypothetical protein
MAVRGRPKKQEDQEDKVIHTLTPQEFEKILERSKELKMDTEAELEALEPGHKLIVRTVSYGESDPTSGAMSVYDVDEYITSFLAAGWDILATHYLGTQINADGRVIGYNFAWVLIR